jgi:hypothetical protein
MITNRQVLFVICSLLQITLQCSLQADNPQSGFGEAVSISGNRILVGASGSANPDDETGAAYTFINTEEGWIQEFAILAPNADVGDQFGASVDIDEDTLVIGAPHEDSDSINNPLNNDADESGAVYVYVWSGHKWNLQAYLKASNIDSEDFFGTSVSISDNAIVVGAIGEDSSGTNENDDTASNAGAVYVFERSEEEWTQVAYLKAYKTGFGLFPAGDEYFGNSVSVSGHWVVVGGVGQDGNSGQTYIFDKNVDWDLIASIR